MRDIVWRDDDINYLTDLIQFKKIHNLFDQYNVTHTIALIAKDIDKAPELIDFIKSKNNIDVQLHCWSHRSMPHILDVLEEELKLGVRKIAEVFGKPPVTLYPPWNNSNGAVIDIAEQVGLTVSTIKSGVSNYLKNVGHIEEKVINFHYWNDGDVMFLQQALELYIKRQTRCV